VASAFIIVVHSEFQPNLNEETNALIRVMIYTTNNSAFGGVAPTVPERTGTPPTMVQVQAILVASFCVSLFSALLAMLGKQWLNRCTPANIRGTIIERSRYRQRKLDGIANWYFDYVMESLPLMLQVALLLLGCALSRYLWEYNTTVASVVVGVTSFGVLFYLFIVIAGVVSVNCPYQTPAADFLRHIPDAIGRIPHILYWIQDTTRSIRDMFRHIPHIPRHLLRAFGMTYSLFCTSIEVSTFLRAFMTIGDVLGGNWRGSWLEGTLHHLQSEDTRYPSALEFVRSFNGIQHTWRHPRPSIANRLLKVLFLHILLSPLWLAVDACKVMAWLLVGLTHLANQARLELQAKQQMFVHVSDLRCISWTLQISVDEPVRRLALEYLTTMTLDDSDPIQVVEGWFDTLFDCVKVINGNVTIVQGLEELTAASSLFFLRMLSHLVVMDPMPKILEDIHRRYTRTIPSETSFADPLVPCLLGAIHRVFHQNHIEGRILPFPQHRVWWRVQWNNYEPSSDEHVKAARVLTNFARFGYQRSGSAKVPRWILRFALHSLSQDPPPPASVVTDSLSIIAIDLGCDVPDIVTINPPDQRCVRIKQVIITLT